MLYRFAQRLAHVALSKPRNGAEKLVPDVASHGRRYMQEALRPSVEPDHALQQQVAQSTRKLTLVARAARSSSAKKGFPSERETIVPVSAACSGESARAASNSINSSSLERAQLEHEPRVRASDAVRKPAHALRRGELVCAIGREQQNLLVDEVVREENEEIERRRVSPVHVLEHDQHRCESRSVGEQRERVLEHAQLRARRLPIGAPRLPERSESLEERLVRQLRADEIDRAPEKDLESGIAGASRKLGGEPGLADARFSGDEDCRTVPRLRPIERAPELPELACASDEDVARANHHLSQYRADHRPGRARSLPRPEDKAPGRGR